MSDLESLSCFVTQRGYEITALRNNDVMKYPVHPYEVLFTKQDFAYYKLWHTETVNKNTCFDNTRDRVLVIYTFHEYDDNVKYFLQKGYFRHPLVDFLFVVNDENFSGNLPGKVLIRENKGHDFGAWTRGIYHEDNFDKYDICLCKFQCSGTFCSLLL